MMQDVVFVQNIAFCANFAKFCFCANYFAQYCSKLVAYDAEYCAKLGPPPCTNYAQNVAKIKTWAAKKPKFCAKTLPVHPNRNLSKTWIHFHYGSNPRDTTKGLQNVTYSPGEHPHSCQLRISWCGNLLLREHPFPANLSSNCDNLLPVLWARNLTEGRRSM